MIVYRCSPIDSNWENLQTVAEFASQLAARDAKIRVEQGDRALLALELTVDEFVKDWEEARSAAYSRGWEGDCRQGPNIFWLPNETGFAYGFVFKQDNNGETYIISPYQLPWVERFAY